MHLEDHPLAIEWLKQFKGADQLRAVFLLRSLILVSHSEFEKGLDVKLDEIISLSDRPIAAFPVSKFADSNMLATDEMAEGEGSDTISDSNIESETPSSVEKEQVAGQSDAHHSYGSEDRVGHFLTAKARSIPNRLLINPTVAAMRATKLDEVVFVDDLIGSGRKIRKFWKSWANPTLRSWLSAKHCRFHIVSYAAHPKGVQYVRSHLPYLRSESISIYRLLPTKVREWNPEITKLVDYYGEKTGKPRAARGIGDIMLPLVFQHRCPNNAPAILWSGSHSWNALFKERRVDPVLYPCFNESDTTTLQADTLWESGQLKLAIALLDGEALGRLKPGFRDLVVVLGLLAQRMKVETISSLLVLGAARTERIVRYARAHRFIDESNQITQLGKGILNRARWMAMVEQRVESKRSGFEYYYPKQYDGVRR